MDFKTDKRIDGQLREALQDINKQIDVLHEIEKRFLFVDAHKKAILASLIVEQLQGSFAMREAKALASETWKVYCLNHADGEAEYNRAKRRYELLLKSFDGAYLSLKTEVQTIRRSGNA